LFKGATTFIIKGLYVTFSASNTQHNDAECRVLFIIMLIVIRLSIVRLNVVMLSVMAPRFLA